MDETGVEKKEWFDSFKAIIIQHEIDHLHGILFTQRAVEQNKILYKETDGELSPIQLI
jgi:peptide deformylase